MRKIQFKPPETEIVVDNEASSNDARISKEDTQSRMNTTVRFSLLLPILVLLLSISFTAVSATRNYYYLHRAEKPGSNLIEIGAMGFPKQNLGQFVCSVTAMSVYKPITAFNAPAFIFDALISIPEGPNSNMFVNKYGLETWRVISYPFFAIPAWWFVGRGIDGFTKKVRIRKLGLAMSILLAIIFAVLATGLKFALTESERQGQDSLTWLITGLAFWAVLISVPACAWFRAKISSDRQEPVITSEHLQP